VRLGWPAPVWLGPPEPRRQVPAPRAATGTSSSNACCILDTPRIGPASTGFREAGPSDPFERRSAGSACGARHRPCLDSMPKRATSKIPR
jgi:hypothetical protein